MKRSFQAHRVATPAELSKSSQPETLPTTLSNNGVPTSEVKTKSENSKRQIPTTVTRDTHSVINDVAIEREVLNNLQKANGIRTLTGHVSGISLELPVENTNEKTSNAVHYKPEVQDTRM